MLVQKLIYIHGSQAFRIAILAFEHDYRASNQIRAENLGPFTTRFGAT